ncbi:hypothetical protein V7201_17785 [Bacillus sp. JJ1122]|uniref:hypothetical protein n=1 Tax=Bacillus sp. JJ1122 TaxID=3122951 RepID=UPI002FFD5D68
MAKKKLVFTTLSFFLFIILFTIIWAYHHKIIDGHYTRLTIKEMGGTTKSISDLDDINKIMDDINNNPRSFNPNNGFRYDYLPHGVLIFENAEEKVELRFVISKDKGNVITKYCEIETEFEFE